MDGGEQQAAVYRLVGLDVAESLGGGVATPLPPIENTSVLLGGSPGGNCSQPESNFRHVDSISIFGRGLNSVKIKGGV